LRLSHRGDDPPGKILTRTMTNQFSLTPGFSPVVERCPKEKPFQRFFPRRQAVKTAEPAPPDTTRLKPGVNETQT
jgi:hypothetical protein